MKKSLTIKMFTLTFVSFMILITCILAFNTLYFNRVYERHKINSIINNINKFDQEFKQYRWNDYELYRQIDILKADNNIELSIISSTDKSYVFPYYSFGAIEDGYTDGSYDYNVEHDANLNFSYIITVEDNKTYYQILMNKNIYEKVFNNGDPFKGDKLEIIGYTESDNIIQAQKINGIQIISDELESNFSKVVFIVKVESFNSEYNEIQGVESSINYAQQVDEYGDSYEVLVKEKNGVEYAIENIPFSKEKQITLLKSTVDGSGREMGLLAYASLQPVNEAVAVVNNYYIYFYILAAFISLIVAIVYSRYVTKPLIKLSHSASRMATMDFSNNYEVSTNDELGILSKSLVIMSLNLEKTLTQLKAANEQLKLDYDKEIKQEKARKEFVANVSHELKTPLGIIRGFAEGIKDGIKKEKRDYYIDVILDEVEKMNELILDMLELSKLEAGALKLCKEQFSLKGLISRTTSVFELPISEKNLQLDISGVFLDVIADKSKIEQVLFNLIANAIKYSSIDSQIKVKGEVIDSKNYIYIENYCDPLSDDDLESIWNRFYKADKSHNRESGGTGLGLAIVRAILESHGFDYGVVGLQNGVKFYFAIDAI